MKKRILEVTLIMCMATMLFAGCKKKEEPVDTEAQVSEVVATETQTEEEETREGMLKSPYTGLWIDENLAKERPIALMIENTSACLPQYGLNKTDIVYECPVEGGITRLMGIFQDYTGMEKLGNVRSCRHYYCYFAHEYDAIYVHAGKSPKGKKVLESGYIDNIDGAGNGGSYFFRSSEHAAPHNLYISSENITKAIEALKYETKLPEDYAKHFNFAKEEEPVDLSAGVDAAVVSLYFYNNKPYFVYNQEDGLYYRYEFGKEQMDAIDNTQAVTKNILIQICKSKTLDSKLRLDVYTSGEGKGYYISNGKCIEITWKKDDKDGKTQYFDKDGNELVINPGRTWVEICEKDGADGNKFYSSLEEFKK